MDCKWKGPRVEYRALSGSPEAHIGVSPPGTGPSVVLADCSCEEGVATYRTLPGSSDAQRSVSCLFSKPAEMMLDWL